MVLKIVAGVLIGGVLGAVLGYFGKCSSGACPLTANPYRGAVYGAVMGAAVAIAFSSGRTTGPPYAGRAPGSVREIGTGAESAVLIVTDQTFEQEVLNSTLPVMVDMWAPWCGPCRMVSPVIEELAAENADRIKVCKLNVDENQNIANRYGIQAIPSLLFFRDGGELKALRIAGARRKAAYREAIDRATRPTAQ